MEGQKPMLHHLPLQQDHNWACCVWVGGVGSVGACVGVRSCKCMHVGKVENVCVGGCVCGCVVGWLGGDAGLGGWNGFEFFKVVQ